MSNRVRLEAKPPVATRKPINLMLDSGAFSAWQSGKEVDMGAYIRFLQRYKDYLFSYVNMDTPPGGVQNTEPEDAARTSDYNLQKMLDAGVSPMPVFHQFEDWKWLYKMVRDGHRYIGISSRLTLPINQRVRFLNDVFARLCDEKGRVCVRTHGFGMGALELARDYPFYTVDSTSWILGSSAYGRVLVPALDQRMKIKIGETRSLYVGRVNRGQHLLDLDLQKEQLAQYLSEAGIAEEDTTTSFIARAKLGSLLAKHLIEERAKNPCMFLHRVSKPFIPDEEEPPKMRPIKPFTLKVFCVAWGNVMNHVLNEIGNQDRLMSYLQIKNWDEDKLERYMVTGFPAAYTYGGAN